MSGFSVLHISNDSVSWLARDEEECVLRADRPEREDAIAGTAIRLLKENSERRRTCVLALDESFYKRRQVDLPASLDSRELAGSLRRKAANLLGSADDALYHALPLCGNKQNNREGIQSWFLFTLEAPRLRSLMDSLSRVGFIVRRVLAAETAYHGTWQPRDLATDEAAVLIGQLHGSIGVSLIGAGGLVSHNVVPVASLTRDAMASTFVQELRSMDSHWRKLSEGGAVTQAHLWGFDQDWEESIAPAAHLVLPDLELSSSGVRGCGDGGSGELLPTLVPCRTQSDLSVNFTLSTPPRRKVSAMLLAASVACVATLGIVGRSGLTQSVGAIEEDLRMRTESGMTLGNLDHLRAELGSLQAIESDFNAEWRAFTGTGTSNIPYSRVCAEVLRALGEDAALESINMSAVDGAVQYSITGAVPAQTQRAAKALAETRQRFSTLDAFEGFTLEPATKIPGRDKGTDLLQFTIKGTWNARTAFGSLPLKREGGGS